VLSTIRAGLVSKHDSKLVDELLEAYREAKDNYYRRGLRLSAVEGGRFCEAAFRLLQERTRGTSDHLGTRLDTGRIIRDLENIPTTAEPDSIRLHIPRALRLVYDIRNNRDAVHLADGIDPNLQDATLVVSVLDWVLAEFVRLYLSVSPDEAQRIVTDLVTRRVPAIQDFDGFPKVLKPYLPLERYVLLLLFQRGHQGATRKQLAAWTQDHYQKNKLEGVLEEMRTSLAYLHFDGTQYKITGLGEREVEKRRLYDPPE